MYIAKFIVVSAIIWGCLCLGMAAESLELGAVKYQAAIYVDGKFVCSGVTQPDRKVVTAASCISYKDWYNTYPFKVEQMKVVVGSIDITPILSPELDYYDVIEAGIDRSFNRGPPAYGKNLGYITHDGPKFPSPHVIGNVTVDTNLVVQGYSSGDGTVRCRLNATVLKVLPPKRCTKKADWDTCARLIDFDGICPADPGSPVYTNTNPSIFVGIISNTFDDNKCNKQNPNLHVLNSTAFN